MYKRPSKKKLTEVSVRKEFRLFSTVCNYDSLTKLNVTLSTSILCAQ